MYFKLPNINKKFIVCAISAFTVYLFVFNIVIVKWFTKTGNRLSSVVLPYVIVHIDLKGGPPKLTYLESLIPLLKHHGVNGLLMEYEDMFPYEGKLVNLSARNHYYQSELKSFLITASLWGLEVIPLIQTFGHMEYALKLKEFKELRENPLYPDSICPSREQSRQLIKLMLEQVVKFHNSVSPLKHIHIGCDEVYNINICRHCELRKASDRELFLDHVSNIALQVKDMSSNVTILIWDDMLRSIKPYEWTDINNINDIEPVIWSYKNNPYIPHVSIYQYHKKFKNIWAASAFKGADGITAAFPNLQYRASNHFGWMNYLLDHTYPGENKVSSFQGIILTGWSRYSHMEPSCELLPVSLPSLVINLLIIKRFKEGVDLGEEKNVSVFISQYLNDDINKSLKCYLIGFKMDNDQNFSCDFESVKLYNTLKQLMMLIDKVTSNFSNKLSGLVSMECYPALNYINVYTLKDKLAWCNNIMDSLTRLENILIKEMKRYYENDFVYEYINDKTCYVKKHLELAIKVLNRNNHIQEWERGPRVVNLTII